MPPTLAPNTLRLENYILANKYRGYDRYDGLESPLFKLPALNNKKLRFLVQQITKRSLLNLRPLLGIPKGYNPVTLGLCLQGFAYLSQVFPEKNEIYLERIEILLDELIRLQSKGFSGACWGYDFDWEARYASIPAFTPTVVATGIITNSLFIAYELTQNRHALDLCISAVDFIRKDLNKVYEGDLFCYSYSPLDKQIVFNATMKGARLLSQVYSINSDSSLLNEAALTVQFVMKHQNRTGAWVYSHNDNRDWVDNYHTGYILDCLETFVKLTGDETHRNNLELGFQFYCDNFFEHEKIPKFYDQKKYPVDCTSAAQSILTLVRFGKLKIAENVANWMVSNMQAKDGHFYFRKYKYFTSKISFMRWSNAWMFAALSYLLFKNSDLR
ncbi:MAG: delta-aminolevulinic acid dehydratase [Calditrichaeota bacterium]|nr:MAG: delta-aminolevulinic acid dehydratase [Calditrichota bacterium]